MSAIDAKRLISEEIERRNNERAEMAAEMVEQAVDEAVARIVPAAADLWEGTSQSMTAGGASADTSVPSPPQPSSRQSSSPGQLSSSAHSQGLIQLAVQELARYRAGSDEQLKALEERSRHLSTLTGADQQQLAAELANQLAQQPQPQPEDSTSTGSDQSKIRSKVRNAFRSDDQG